MKFAEAVDYLYSIGNELSTMKLGLENIRRLLEALDDPQKHYLKIQVAGTNGKGSVCAFLDSICLAAGIKTGLYTSPHLVSITERITINGRDIADDAFAQLTTRVRGVVAELVAARHLESIPTFFEQVTAIALVAFSEASVELAILETGLGGRLDATTAARAEIAAITRIDRDHQQYLGEAIEEIAAEKAAIMRPDTHALIVGEQEPAAAEIISMQAKRSAIELRPAGRVRSVCDSEGVKFETERAEYQLSRLGLRGVHQIENAKIAILIAEELQKHFVITCDHIVEGLQSARHPGRLEYDGNFLFDGAHNPGGARVLIDYLNEFERRPLTLIFGAMRDKDVAAMAEIVFPVARKLILTRAENDRAMPPEEIAEFAVPAYDGNDMHVAASAKDAVAFAKRVTPDDGLILVTGSLYLVGDVKRITGALE